jgi:hypothetical protein
MEPSAKGATSVKAYESEGSSRGTDRPMVSWEDAWKRVQDPIRAKMQQVADLLQTNYEFMVSSVMSYEHDEMFGFVLEIGRASEASEGMAPLLLTGGLHDGAEHDGEPGDFFIAFELTGPGGLAFGRYAPGMYTEQAYVRTTEELLQRIDAFDVRQSAQDIMATAWRERDSKGWEFV